MTDLRAEATRIGYWNEGLGAWRHDWPTIDWTGVNRWLDSGKEGA